MAAYHYIALSRDGKELSGIIEASDDSQARTKLNGLGLSIVSLEVTNQISSTPEHPSKTTFEFTAFDKNGKKVVGTIAADDPAEAYGRLFGQYQLDITSLSANSEQLDLTTTAQTYQKLHEIDGAQASAGGAESTASTEDEEKRQALLQKVDFTMSRIQEFLKKYNTDLKNEEKDTIQAYINQLIRIKDSTNLEHVRITCEKMLNHIQKQELFIYEEQKTKESTEIKVETKELLSSLKSTGFQQDIDVIGILEKLQNNRFLKPFAEMLLRIGNAQTPEIRRMRSEVKSVKHHMWEYFKILITGKNSAVRHEAWQTLKTLRAEKNRLNMQLAALVQEEKAKVQEDNVPNKRGEYIHSGAGWIFGVYLVFYALTYPFTTKNIPGIVLPKNLYFYATTLPKYLTIFFFLFYASLQIQNFFFKSHRFSGVIIYPLSIVLYLLIIINLM